MAQVYNQIQVDVRTSTQDIITAVQFDSASRFLDVTLTDNGVAVDLTDHEVRLFAKKADTTEYYADGEITAATTGRCQFELTDQMLAVAQDIEVQIITYYDNTEVLQAPVFTIHVVKSLITDSAVESSNEYGALVVLYQNLYEAYDLMTTMVQNIGVPSEIAEGLSIDTMWEAWEWMVDYTGNDLTELITEALANASVQGVLDVIGTPPTDDATVFSVLENSTGKVTTTDGVFSPVMGKQKLLLQGTILCGAPYVMCAYDGSLYVIEDDYVNGTLTRVLREYDLETRTVTQENTSTGYASVSISTSHITNRMVVDDDYIYTVLFGIGVSNLYIFSRSTLTLAKKLTISTVSTSGYYVAFGVDGDTIYTINSNSNVGTIKKYDKSTFELIGSSESATSYNPFLIVFDETYLYVMQEILSSSSYAVRKYNKSTMEFVEIISPNLGFTVDKYIMNDEYVALFSSTSTFLFWSLSESAFSQTRYLGGVSSFSYASPLGFYGNKLYFSASYDNFEDAPAIYSIDYTTWGDLQRVYDYHKSLSSTTFDIRAEADGKLFISYDSVKAIYEFDLANGIGYEISHYTKEVES